MPELIDVRLEDLEMQDVVTVIFPLINGIHRAYLTEYIEGNYGQHLFRVLSIISEHEYVDGNTHPPPIQNIDDTFVITPEEVTSDMQDRTKYMVLREETIHFPPDLEDAYIDTNIDDEISNILNNRNRFEETERSRMLRMLMLGRRPTQSPLLQSVRNSPNPRSGYRAGGKKRRRRTTRKRRTHKRSKRKRLAPTRRRRRNSRVRR